MTFMGKEVLLKAGASVPHHLHKNFKNLHTWKRYASLPDPGEMVSKTSGAIP